MHKTYIKDLQTRLRNAGVAPQHAQRTADEFHDHLYDLTVAAQQDGASEQQAMAAAIREIGPIDELVRDMSSRRELLSWAHRYPRAAVVYYPVACVAMLPAYPIVASMAHASSIARWGASLLVAGVFTGFMLLMMQLSIFLG